MHAWLEIDLSTVSHNLGQIKKTIGSGVDVIAVVKADAYGHGLKKITQTLDTKDVSMFAVMMLEEAQEVRRISDKPILLMGYLDMKELTDAIDEGYILSLYDKEQFGYYQRTAERMGKRVVVHLKVETGLNRLGVMPDDAAEFLIGLHRFPNIDVKAIFSHLSCADKKDQNLAQLRVIQDLLVAMQGKVSLLPIHLVSSYALKNFKEGYFDAVRVGLALYGMDNVVEGLKPTLACKSKVMQVKEILAGEGISHSRYHVTDKATKIAIISIGYSDGLSQVFRGNMSVLINGDKCPIIGQICMNHIIADVTKLKVKRDNEVVIIGQQKSPEGKISEITISELAEQGRIRHHEIVTRLGGALAKLYL